MLSALVWLEPLRHTFCQIRMTAIYRSVLLVPQNSTATTELITPQQIMSEILDKVKYFQRRRFWNFSQSKVITHSWGHTGYAISPKRGTSPQLSWHCPFSKLYFSNRTQSFWKLKFPGSKMTKLHDLSKVWTNLIVDVYCMNMIFQHVRFYVVW